jgi:hypothetical protein
MDMDVNMNPEFAQLVRVRSLRRRSRWNGPGVSECLAQFEKGTVPRRQAINLDKVLGLATALAVGALGWSVVGLAVSHFLR